jgi:hypothetical protein
MAQTKVLVYVDGKKVDFPDQQPYIDSNNRTMVPVRFVSEALGAKVTWDGVARKVGIDRNNKNIVLTINQRIYLINGSTQTMDTEAVITTLGRTMVPVRFVAEGLGAVVRWDVVGANGVVHNFTLGQSEAEINNIMQKVRDNLLAYEWKNGYQIPKETQMKISVRDPATDINKVSISWLVYMRDDIYAPHLDMAKQYEQSYTILASKFGHQVAEEVVNYIKTKDDGAKELPHIWLVRNGHTIGVSSLWGSPTIAVTIWAYEVNF